jgi:hypothetical protein
LILLLRLDGIARATVLFYFTKAGRPQQSLAATLWKEQEGGFLGRPLAFSTFRKGSPVGTESRDWEREPLFPWVPVTAPAENFPARPRINERANMRPNEDYPQF